MAFETIRYEVNDGIATVTMNRPEKLNAFNGAMVDELFQVVEEVYERDEIRVLILTGAGRAFSSGADYEWFNFEEWGPVIRTRARRLTHRLFDDLEYLEKPVIAAINGTCAGGGLELALSCDLRIAAGSARLGFPEVNAGIIPGSGGCSRLFHVVGIGRAKELILMGELISAERAETFGLVNLVVPPDALMPKAREMAETLIRKGPLAIGLAKHVINAALGVDPATGRVLERLGSSLLIGSDDAREGAQAFREKRPPRFQGR
ncbi:MAG: enoyl-CoA hydratase/isomerase family protein [Candidatus Rokubacteria bacterium]|nr:enoyl-CoA hydratase/isomerase family protein [Candidatus Rokubacteria bacterium]